MSVPLIYLILTIFIFGNGEVYSSNSNSSSGKKMETNKEKRPNIILIIADDLGWNDVSFHGSNQIPTPNIDALGYNGVILNNHYVQPLCTPSRASLLTGKYPINMGMQHSVLLEPEPRGLPLNQKLIPEFLRDVGYKTHAIGKWHLGFYRREYTPCFRGFDTHFGYWNGLQDYYSHFVQSTLENYRGFDMRRNMSVAWDTAGKYSTDLFTEEAIRLIDRHDQREPMFLYLAHLAPHTGNKDNLFQAPDEEIAKFSYIKDPKRRIYAAMVSKLDQGVGDVVAALKRQGMLDNSIIVFLADNGAPTMGIYGNHGSNYPLRGIKASPWDGAVRGAAVIWSPLIKNSRRVANHLMHISDWLPTLYSAAGYDSKNLGEIDGKNLWSTIVREEKNPRTEILINIDEISNFSAIRRGDFKYLSGSAKNGDNWYGDTGRPEQFPIEGISPKFNPQDVLQSKVGIAISQLNLSSIQERAEKNFAGKRNRIGSKGSLTSEEILRLRIDAELICNLKENITCDSIKAPCLFNIKKDPCERINLASIHSDVLNSLETSISFYKKTMMGATNVANDPKANPINWNGVWTNWKDSSPIVM